MVQARRAPAGPHGSAARRDTEQGAISRRDPGTELGAVAVEFALLAPLLFFVLFGTMVVGWRIWEHQAGQSTVREASRLAGLGIDDAATFARTVVCLGQRNGLESGGITQVSVQYLDGGMAKVPTAVYPGWVEVSVTSQSRLGAFPLVASDDGTFTSTGVTRIEQLGSVVATGTTSTTGVTCP